MQIDLALLLSEHYGKNVRQGQKFTIDGIQAFIRPADEDTGEFVDVGVSAACKIGYYPATGHARKAWNNVYRQWRSQKNLAGAVGPQIRNDDLEFAWNYDKKTDRTSTIFGTGLGDTTEEHLVLTGQSTGTEDFSLEDYYNSAFPAPAPSRNHFDNSVIKYDKFGSTPFPSVQHLYCAATNTAHQGVLSDTFLLGLLTGSSEGLSSAIADSEMVMLQHNTG
ncbi:MAG: hypothetical protein GY826_01165, partial [Fuerstiella sp.]|nr:hypothetical protein [Fuerstiella sp.]